MEPPNLVVGSGPCHVTQFPRLHACSLPGWSHPTSWPQTRVSPATLVCPWAQGPLAPGALPAHLAHSAGDFPGLLQGPSSMGHFEGQQTVSPGSTQAQRLAQQETARRCVGDGWGPCSQYTALGSGVLGLLPLVPMDPFLCPAQSLGRGLQGGKG